MGHSRTIKYCTWSSLEDVWIFLSQQKHKADPEQGATPLEFPLRPVVSF